MALLCIALHSLRQGSIAASTALRSAVCQNPSSTFDWEYLLNLKHNLIADQCESRASALRTKVPAPSFGQSDFIFRCTRRFTAKVDRKSLPGQYRRPKVIASWLKQQSVMVRQVGIGSSSMHTKPIGTQCLHSHLRASHSQVRRSVMHLHISIGSRSNRRSCFRTGCSRITQPQEVRRLKLTTRK